MGIVQNLIQIRISRDSMNPSLNCNSSWNRQSTTFPKGFSMTGNANIVGFFQIPILKSSLGTVEQGCISCGILVSGIRARGVSSEHMENMAMFSYSPT